MDSLPNNTTVAADCASLIMVTQRFRNRIARLLASPSPRATWTAEPEQSRFAGLFLTLESGQRRLEA
jgi:hypothetical protein